MTGDGDSQLKISVIVPTYNRADTLSETLRYLAEQELDAAEYEVVIIDDGSTDDTRAVVDEWVPRARFLIRYHYQTNHGPGHAYNRGLEAAQAPIVLYSADDMLLEPGALKAHLAMHATRPEPEVTVQGEAALSPMLNQSVFLKKFDRSSFNEFAGEAEVPYYRFGTCNVSAKRDFVLQHGRMPEQIGPGGSIAHQDPELGYQLSHAGLRILYCPEAVAFHHQVMTLEEACRNAYKRGLNFPEFRERVGQPEIAVAYHVWDSSTISDHLRVWFGPRRGYVLRRDRNPIVLLGIYLLRFMVFNALTVRLVWEPLAGRAERDPAVARFMRSRFYRGIVSYYFRRGCRDGRSWSGPPAAQPKQA